MKTRKIAMFVASALSASVVWAAGPLDALDAKLEAAKLPGTISLAVVSSDAHGGTLAATSHVGDEALTPETSFRVASNTKPYVAATVLRLWEDGKIKLDASIREYVAPAYLAALDKDGYDTAKITVRELLSHTSGIADHTMTKEFEHVLDTRPGTAWTRESQMDALVRWTDPVGKPGEKFYYSDDGYCLLGNIIERLTGKPLAVAVHNILDYDKLGLSGTYWETQEPEAANAKPRAHQFYEGRDTYNWNPSLDMYGGGGIVASPQDLARFLYDLFEGKVFKHPETLQLMLSKEGIPTGSPYRIGLFEYDAGGTKVYWHSGYWGTAAFYVPSQHRAYAFAITQRQAYKEVFGQVRAYIVQ
jgi:D-alanyl-D-alanine carboxypeptidase